MLDIKFVLENADAVKASEVARGNDPEVVDELLKLYDARNRTCGQFDEVRAKQQLLGKSVAAAKTQDERSKTLQELKLLAQKVDAAKLAAVAAQNEYDVCAQKLQNVVVGAPSGGEDDYVVLKEVGQCATEQSLGFSPKHHSELGEQLGIIDTDRGSKVSGSRFYFLKGLGARLDLALINMGLDLALSNGFTPMVTPTLVRPEVMRGTGFLGLHDAEVYRLSEADDLYLVGTSEVALAGYYSDEIVEFLDGKPIKFAGFSACYRREAGAAGKDTRGIIRVHQFHKLEMFVYCMQEHAEQEHAKLLEMEEQMISALELPYRVIDVAAGDLGSSAARKFDCEAWLPSENRYLELTSTSNCTTFQARRLGIRERFQDENAQSSTRSVATLNGTLATTRWIVAILENHQQEDRSVRIPEALRPYLGGVEVITPDSKGA
ncbi:MAG: serine--tRNA ligase [Candidatus Ancillula trichonymphae]|jgi:seryl-tRNA synthetase|nr:serine--tRNA ligase [Candidatus Ancillula trichonymphae]